VDGAHAGARSLTRESSPFAHVLAATDGSERAQEALARGARLAALSEADLEIAFVIDTRRAHEEDVEPRAQAILERAAEIARAEGADPVVRVLAGDPAEAILREAADRRTDLICVGPDAGLLGGAIRIGRVAAHVLRQAACSVLVGREAGADFPSVVQCAVDASESSVDTARLAAEIARLGEATLRLQHVIPIFRGDNAEWTLDEGEPSPPEIELAVEVVRSLGVEPIREIAMGRPEHALVEMLRRDAADLAILGHRGLSGVERVLLGSVSEYVATHAPCSVLVARPGAGA